MAAAIPIIGVFAAGAASAGTAAAGFAAVGALATGSLAGFLTVAGGIAGTIGALSGKKSLQKIGGLMALGGGVMGLATGAFGGAVDAATGASGASAAQEAANAAWAAGGQAEVAALGSDIGQLGGVAEAAPQGADTIWNRATQQPTGLDQINNADPSAVYADPAADQVGQANSLYARSQASNPGVGPAQANAPVDPMNNDPLAKGAASMTRQELDQYLATQKAKAQAALKSSGGWIKDNKELVALGGSALASMYGPQAESLDWQKSLYNRRTKNLNTPIPLANGVR